MSYPQNWHQTTLLYKSFSHSTTFHSYLIMDCCITNYRFILSSSRTIFYKKEFSAETFITVPSFGMQHPAQSFASYGYFPKILRFLLLVPLTKASCWGDLIFLYRIYCFGEEVCGEERKTKRIRHIDIRQTGTSAFVFHWFKTIILVHKIVW